jgi:histidinol-phosphate aminotransferase
MTPIDLRFTVIKQSPPDFIYRAMKPYVDESNNYVHQPEELRHAIARRHGIDPALIQLVAGADQAIMIMAALYGSRTHIFTPTYVGYTDAKRFGTLTEHPSLVDDAYKIATRSLDATLIFLANPNNPAGTTTTAKIIQLIEKNPTAKVVIDEAYGDFVTDSLIPKVEQHSNLYVLRSFSKGFGLAGFRIGYIVAQSEALAELELESTWFNLSYPAVGGALTALEHEDYFAAMRQAIITERNLTVMALKDQGYCVIRGAINAILVRFETVALADTFVKALHEAGILVHQGSGASNVGLDQSYVRLAVGTPEQMARFREVLRDLT